MRKLLIAIPIIFSFSACNLSQRPPKVVITKKEQT